jgi:group I intron endonuclease
MIIYKITNKVNGKIYVGQTTRSLEERWYGHCSTANQHGILGKALIKYGKENFRQEILEYV